MPGMPRGLIMLFVAAWLAMGLILTVGGAVKVTGYVISRNTRTVYVLLRPMEVSEKKVTKNRSGSYTAVYEYTVDYELEWKGETYRVSHVYELNSRAGEQAFKHDEAAPIDPEHPEKGPIFGDELSAGDVFMLIMGIVLIAGGAYTGYANRERLFMKKNEQSL